MPVQSTLRIVHVVRQYEPSRGGLEDFVRCLSRQQRMAGHHVEILTLNRTFQDAAVQLAPVADIHGIRVNRIKFVGTSTYFVARDILGKVTNADIVHVHATDFFFDFLAVCRPFLRARLVCTTHGGFFHTERLRTLKTLWFKTLTRLFLRAYDAVVACSESDYRLFAAYCGNRLTRIDNGVDIDKLRDSGSPTLTKTLVTLGRFSTNKQVGLLLLRFSELAAVDPVWRLRICGVNSDETADELRERARQLGVADAVTVHLGLSDAEIRSVMSEASFFVSASRYEGFGLAAVEAMSAGLQPILHANDAYTALATKHPRIALIDYAMPNTLSVSARHLHDRIEHDYNNHARALKEETSQYGWDRVGDMYQKIYDTCRHGVIAKRLI